jgi:hypothetical protein
MRWFEPELAKLSVDDALLLQKNGFFTVSRFSGEPALPHQVSPSK